MKFAPLVILFSHLLLFETLYKHRVNRGDSICPIRCMHAVGSCTQHAPQHHVAHACQHAHTRSPRARNSINTHLRTPMCPDNHGQAHTRLFGCGFVANGGKVCTRGLVRRGDACQASEILWWLWNLSESVQSAWRGRLLWCRAPDKPSKIMFMLKNSHMSRFRICHRRLRASRMPLRSRYQAGYALRKHSPQTGRPFI